MSIVVVGVGEMKISNSQGSVVKTYALGSCVAVIALSPKWSVAGLLHIALPDSSINPLLAQERPTYFADTGIPVLLKEMFNYGCRLDDIVIKIAGGASVINNINQFQIGKRNVLAVKKVLWNFGLGPIAEDVGKDISRTVAVDIDTNKVLLSSPNMGVWSL